jgi:AraC-like DNA-binding protein
MDSCYADDLDVATVAQRAGVSKYHFIRSFRAAYGQTPAQYLMHRRIERAQDLLRATNLTVTEVCMLVGYTSLGSFSAKFRSLVGETPSEFQQRYSGKGVPHIPGCYVFMRGLRERAILEKPAERSGH